MQKSRPLNQGEWHIKITLIHNPAAGDGSRPSGDDLVELLCAAGHKVNYQSSKEKKWKKALKKPGDIVAVAGGDGTVGKVARRLIGSPTPIAILPLGTANNIANTLDVTGKSLKELIRSWKTARCINFDAGVAKGPWGTESFVEGFGVGLFAETMTRLDGSKIIDLAGADDPPTVLRTVLKILRKQLKEHPATEMTIRLDGKEMSGDYECPICRVLPFRADYVLLRTASAVGPILISEKAADCSANSCLALEFLCRPFVAVDPGAASETSARNFSTFRAARWPSQRSRSSMVGARQGTCQKVYWAGRLLPVLAFPWPPALNWPVP